MSWHHKEMQHEHRKQKCEYWHWRNIFSAKLKWRKHQRSGIRKHPNSTVNLKPTDIWGVPNKAADTSQNSNYIGSWRGKWHFCESTNEWSDSFGLAHKISDMQVQYSNHQGEHTMPNNMWPSQLSRIYWRRYRGIEQLMVVICRLSPHERWFDSRPKDITNIAIYSLTMIDDTRQVVADKRHFF